MLHLPDTDTVTGGYDDGGHSEDILEYRHDNGWSKVADMKDARFYHGISLVNYEDFKLSISENC